jgi:hypothetical protein
MALVFALWQWDSGQKRSPFYYFFLFFFFTYLAVAVALKIMAEK